LTIFPRLAVKAISWHLPYAPDPPSHEVSRTPSSLRLPFNCLQDKFKIHPPVIVFRESRAPPTSLSVTQARRDLVSRLPSPPPADYQLKMKSCALFIEERWSLPGAAFRKPYFRVKATSLLVSSPLSLYLWRRQIFVYPFVPRGFRA